MLRQALLCLFVFSSGAWGLEATMHLEPAKIQSLNQEAIAKGAQHFKQQCLVCHSMRYLTHDAVAEQAGITLETMPMANQNWAFAKPPPDLSLTSRSRGDDWITTYLKSYYQDERISHGFNNLLMPGTSMPNPFIAMQGTQVKVDADDLRPGQTPRLHNLVMLASEGTMTPDQFDQHVREIVTFLHYAAEPKKAERIHLGPYVIVFLLIFSTLAFRLKQSYWQDVPKNKG